ncbi:MAG TPA: Glu/Leu/Phe/Val dehydrogenase [Patescibacteria group bacterium]|nr:Glu/Leu/Phe/Val dehydrogenase [Patescibacteria group bacterium]
MNSMLATAQASIRQAAKELGYDDARITQFLEAEHEHILEVSAGGKTYPAYRVQHSSKLGPHKGGIRFHPNVSLDEVRALATLMSLKTAAVGLALGGGKGGVVVDPRALSEAELEELSRDYARQLSPHLGSTVDIPAPDVNTNGKIIDWMVDEYEKTVGHKDPGSFTGKSMQAGGSEGRTAATGRGGVIVLAEYLQANNLLDKPLTVALQGYGNVGYYFAQLLYELCPNLKLIAIANSKYTWLQPDGINASEVTDPYMLSEAQRLSSDAILSVDADILVLAALEDAITDANVGTVKAGVIVELANGPITEAAATTLLVSGKEVLPDVIANSGGVIVSYLEWQQNLANEHWSEETVNKKLTEILVPATKAMLSRADAKHGSYKEAAFELALQRLLGD